MKYERIRNMREDMDLTQQKIANDLYFTVESYSKYENGHRNPSLEMLVQMANYFDVTTDYLLGRENISAQALTEYEMKLIEAARKADDRAREDALQILNSHAVKTE